MGLIRKLFLSLEIKSRTGVLHFRRWTIMATPWFNIYLHVIYKADNDEYMHDHPWDYVSIPLKGSFIETRKVGDNVRSEIVHFPMFIRRNGEQLHKIQSIVSGPVYTLFLTTKVNREWGYSVDGEWVDHLTYRRLKNVDTSARAESSREGLNTPEEVPTS